MKTKDLSLCALFAVVIAVGAFIKLPISLVPITLQTLCILLTSLILKEKAVYSVLLYIGIGLIGLPVFASGGGLSYILIPSFGYLIGFIICSLVVGRYMGDNKVKNFLICLLGVSLIYLIGIFYFVGIQYLYYHQTFPLSWIFTSLFLIYLPGDFLSILIAVMLYSRLSHFKS